MCVWPILFTALYLLCQTEEIYPTPALLAGYGIELDWGAAIALVYIAFYLVIEQPGVVGPLAAMMVAGALYGSNVLLSDTGGMIGPTTGLYWKQATGVHVFCWIAQFYGHFAHEGRSPALLDNLAQAFLFAPLFVLLEVFFALFNYKPALQRATEKLLKDKKLK